MLEKKHHVFSARTTEEGLSVLNDLRKERNVGWDELVVDAVSAHYGLDRTVMAIPKQVKPVKPKAGKNQKSKARRRTKTVSQTNNEESKEKGGDHAEDRRQLSAQKTEA